MRGAPEWAVVHGMGCRVFCLLGGRAWGTCRVPPPVPTDCRAGVCKKPLASVPLHSSPCSFPGLTRRCWPASRSSKGPFLPLCWVGGWVGGRMSLQEAQRPPSSRVLTPRSWAPGKESAGVCFDLCGGKGLRGKAASHTRAPGPLEGLAGGMLTREETVLHPGEECARLSVWPTSVWGGGSRVFLVCPERDE